MLAPPRQIAAPPLPRPAPWVNVAMLRMDQQRGRPVLVDFWDAALPQSVRCLPYLRAWDERYGGGEHGLRVVGVHAPAMPLVRGRDDVAAACERLEVAWPVLVDPEHRALQDYEVRGWPSRYLFDGEGWLHAFHHGDGGFHDLEHEIQALLGVDEPLTPFERPEDDDDAPIIVPSDSHDGPHRGRYVAGEAWATLAPPPDGPGEVLVDGEPLAVPHPGAYLLRRHEPSAEADLELEPAPGTTCLRTTFLAGVAPG